MQGQVVWLGGWIEESVGEHSSVHFFCQLCFCSHLHDALAAGIDIQLQDTVILGMLFSLHALQGHHASVMNGNTIVVAYASNQGNFTIFDLKFWRGCCIRTAENYTEDSALPSKIPTVHERRISRIKQSLQ